MLPHAPGVQMQGMLRLSVFTGNSILIEIDCVKRTEKRSGDQDFVKKTVVNREVVLLLLLNNYVKDLLLTPDFDNAYFCDCHAHLDKSMQVDGLLSCKMLL